MPSNDYTKMQIIEELKESARLAKLNANLLLVLESQASWLLRYGDKYRIVIPEREKVARLTDKAREMLVEIGEAVDQFSPTRVKRRDLPTGDEAEPS